MKFYRPAKIDWMSFVIAMPLICILMNQLLFGNRQFHDYRIWLYSFPYIYLQGVISWYLHVVIMYKLRERFPNIRQTSKRLTLLGLGHIAVILLSYSFLFYAYDYFHVLGYQLDTSNLAIALYFGMGKTFIATSMWEADFTFRQWKESLAEKEKLEQLTIQYEFDTLKSQVNPHFLFNCFNTLSSLISEDKKQAEIFLNELSKVYRYLLRNNESGVSCLCNEIQFIKSYYQLLQTRHGSAVQLNIETDKKYEDYLIPSLTLQLLVENAVKHNVLSKNHPLVIDIFTTAGNKLVVSNNLQLRTVKAPSNRIGLENIRSKYLLLSDQEIQIMQDEKSFTVVLPLVWNKVSDKKLVTV